MSTFRFDIHTQSTSTRARRGSIVTPHGTIETPAFVTVGTKATVKSLAPEDFELTNTQFIFSNTYHLVIAPGVDNISEAGGIHAFSNLNKPIITDSGGFQVFSLARSEKEQTEEFGKDRSPTKVKITEDGVAFNSHVDGTRYMFTPEYSIDAQKKLGADFIVAFDEDILNKVSKKYTKEATNRTHMWAERCILEFKDTRNKKFNQQMYGVIHGGRFKDLREWSAKTIAEMDFEALALGGVSVGIDNKELHEEMTWVADALQADKRQRHVLGIGTLRDILEGVRLGYDTFDCVLATRYARMGKLYDTTFEKVLKNNDHVKDTTWTTDITKAKFKNDHSPLIESCSCSVCTQYSKAYLNHLFKQRELLAYRLATIHNLYFIEVFFERIRIGIEKGVL